jgi:hypothetical protein
MSSAFPILSSAKITKQLALSLARTSGIKHHLQSPYCLKIQPLLFCLSLTLIPFTHPSPSTIQTFVFQSPVPGPVRLHFLLHRDKKPSGAPGLCCQWLSFPGSPARAPIKTHPPTIPHSLFVTSSLPPPQCWCLCPSGPLTLSLGCSVPCCGRTMQAVSFY